ALHLLLQFSQVLSPDKRNDEANPTISPAFFINPAADNCLSWFVRTGPPNPRSMGGAFSAKCAGHQLHHDSQPMPGYSLFHGRRAADAVSSITRVTDDKCCGPQHV